MGYETGFRIVLISSSDNFLFIKVKKCNFRIEKTGQNHMIKINTTSNGKNWYHVPLGRRQWEHSCDILAQDA